MIEDLENIFKYHAPSENQKVKYEGLRSAAKTLAYVILELAPQGRERSLAMDKLREAVMWANTSIALNSGENT